MKYSTDDGEFFDDFDESEDDIDFFEDDDCLPEHREDGTERYVRQSNDSERTPPV